MDTVENQPPSGAAPAPADGRDRPRPANGIPEERILDAAYEQLLAVGMTRLNMADLARRAGISRATLYRRWPNVRAVVAAVVTREFAALAETAATGEGGGGGARRAVVALVVGGVRGARRHPIVRKILEVDPEFLLPYLFKRLGTVTTAQLARLEEGIRAGQSGDGDGSVRDGDPALLARSVLLTAWSFTFTGPVFVPPGRLAELDTELTQLLDRYLAP